MYKKNDVYNIVPVTTNNCKIYIYIYMMAVSLTLLFLFLSYGGRVKERREKDDQNTKN